MKTLKELNLKPKDLRKVKNWLDDWAQHFINMAQMHVGTIERYDLKNLDFFYFTDCRDILSKNPESVGEESAESIRKRKRAVEYQLLFRFLLGEKLGRKRPCSHCGNDDRWINTLGDGTGHYVYCPKCEMTSVITYPVGYNTCIGRIIADLKKHGFENPLRMTKESVIDTQKKLIKELQSYKYKNKETEKYVANLEAVAEMGEPELLKVPPLKTLPKFMQKKESHRCRCKKKKD